MSGRTWSSAALLALAVALPLTPVVTTTALADPGPVRQVAPQGNSGDHRMDTVQGASGDHRRVAAKGDNGKRVQKGKQARAKFNVGGRLTAVDLEAGTVTVQVRGGQVKAVRGTDLTVQVADGARVWRNDAAATLADLEVGDKVRAKGTRADGAWTAKRVNAQGPAADEDGGGSTPV